MKSTANNTTPQLSQKKLPSIDQSKAFSATLSQARTHMTGTQKLASCIIHMRVLDYLAASLETTLLRPRSVFYGSIGAAISLVVTYYIAKHIGYTLSGSEIIIGFLAGWVIGLLQDTAAWAKIRLHSKNYPRS